MSSECAETLRDKKEKHTHHIAALCFGIFCIGLGLPIWWKTTEVYRVSLPYSDIQELSDQKIEYASEVEVIWAVGNDIESAFLTKLAGRLDHLLAQGDQSFVSPKYFVAVRKAVDVEIQVLADAKSQSELAAAFPASGLHQYQVVVSPPSPLLPRPLLAPASIMLLPYNGADENGVALQINQLVKDVVREASVQKNFEAAKGLKLQKPDKSSMRSFRFSPAYDVTFTLMVPDPASIDVTWDIEQSLRDYFEPLKRSIADYVNLTVSSQVLYFIDIGKKPKRGNNYYYYEEKDLPHIINPLESRLGSHASSNPAMNLIIYIPPSNRYPLKIHDKNGVPLASNAFLSPRWGGVMVYNPDVAPSAARPRVGLDMRRVMEVAVTQARLLLSIDAQLVTEELAVLREGGAGLPQWELAGWLRGRTVENLAATALTLQSLAQLLGEISNIVINDDIGQEVAAAASQLREGQRLLAAGQLRPAFLAARQAQAHAHTAFFHPSLLELLYFPEDQKFAIYIPLFLPISFPVISSLVMAVKYFKKQRKEKSE